MADPVATDRPRKPQRLLRGVVALSIHDSTPSARPDKPNKPDDDSPLFARAGANGQEDSRPDVLRMQPHCPERL
jgi:hypothetical protein